MLAEVTWNAWQIITVVVIILGFIAFMEHGWPGKK